MTAAYLAQFISRVRRSGLCCPYYQAGGAQTSRRPSATPFVAKVPIRTRLSGPIAL